MAVTHQYAISVRAEVCLFVITLGLTGVILCSDFFAPMLPYSYLLLMYPFTVYLCYVAKRLFAIGKTGHGIFLSITSVAGLVIASIYDFYLMPGEETNLIFNFFFLALVTWSASFVAIYFAYVALNDARKTDSCSA